MRPLIPIALAVLIGIGVASASGASAQQLSRSSIERGTAVLAVQPELPGSIDVRTSDRALRSELDQRIADARLRYQNNRIIGTGLIAVGATAVLGSLADWATANEFGMRHGSAAIMVGGMNLVFWGTDRHRLARQSLELARALEARATLP